MQREPTVARASRRCSQEKRGKRFARCYLSHSFCHKIRGFTTLLAFPKYCAARNEGANLFVLDGSNIIG